MNFLDDYPLVSKHIENHQLFVYTHYKWPFSIAMLVSLPRVCHTSNSPNLFPSHFFPTKTHTMKSMMFRMGNHGWVVSSSRNLHIPSRASVVNHFLGGTHGFSAYWLIPWREFDLRHWLDNSCPPCHKIWTLCEWPRNLTTFVETSFFQIIWWEPVDGCQMTAIGRGIWWGTL